MSGPFVEIAGGHRLHLQDWGEGHTLLFLAGWAMDARGWGDTMLRLNRAGFRTVAYDRRGHGRSTDPGGYDYDTLADDLASVLAAIDAAEVTLIGHSGAGGEILRYLSRHGSSRVRNVVLAGATGPAMRACGPGTGGLPAAAVAPVLDRLVEDMPGWIADNIGPFAPGAGKAMLDWLSLMPLDASRRALVGFQQAILTTDLTADARAVAVPVTLIHGDADLSAPLDWTARRYAALIPGARLVVYPGAAHGLMVTHAARLAEDIAAACTPRSDSALP